MALKSSEAEYTRSENVELDQSKTATNTTQIFGTLKLLKDFKHEVENPVNGHVDLLHLGRLVSVLETILRCICANHEKVKICQDAFTDIARAVEDAKQKQDVTKMNLKLEEMTRLLKTSEKRLLHLEQKVAGQDVSISQLLMAIPQVKEEALATDGVLMWCLDNYIQRKQNAKVSGPTSIYSNDFYSDPYGYRMCARIYLNGDGVGKNTHLSLFFAIKKGKYDDVLKWPFDKRVKFSLLNQNGGEHLKDAFRPDPSSSSFQKPTSDLNIASGCPTFASQPIVETGGYLKNNKIWVKVTVGI